MTRNLSKTIHIMTSASAIAALFHDFGKSTILFQNKLNPKIKTKSFEPYRHELVSYRLFQAFVCDDDDVAWLKRLKTSKLKNNFKVYKDGIDTYDYRELSEMSNFSKLVAWLILTHHKLPLYPSWKDTENDIPILSNIDQSFDTIWNSHNCKDEDRQAHIKSNWTFHTLPFESYTWKMKANELACYALKHLNSDDFRIDLLNNETFTAHMSRLCLMLADHYYSSLPKDLGVEKWRSNNYKVYANTDVSSDGKLKTYKQQLDEHLIGVATNSVDIVQNLFKLNDSLRSLQDTKNILAKVDDNILDESLRSKLRENFGWQDKAKALIDDIGDDVIQHGFFGINMASTGKGKTRANAKIMTTIGTYTGRIRFSVAIGLRSLTLQTASEFKKELGLTDNDLSTATGNSAVKDLFEKMSENKFDTGSESADSLVDDNTTINSINKEVEHSLSTWTNNNNKFEKLVSAPILVSTIDYIMPATEGIKGGKQIPAMLRLFTSDIIIDEPDDFGINDLPALCRLVNWAGMLGSRVLLSTATIPPALAFSLFQAYSAGRKEFIKSNTHITANTIVCAWFDEASCTSKYCNSFESFKSEHEKFTEMRVKFISNTQQKRFGSIVNIDESTDNITENMANTIQQAAIELHKDNNITNNNKTISVGLVRMSNINPLVDVTKALLALPINEPNTRIYYCVYHSKFPLAIRSTIENKLDRILNRKNEEMIFEHREIKDKLLKFKNIDNHIFIIIASPVAEVGRDHDYDWAIVEPSSGRSIIQLAGRVLRHRNIFKTKPNIFLLNKNYKSLNNEFVCYNKPGFESYKLYLESHDLHDNLDKKQYETITSIDRIILRKDIERQTKKLTNLIDLEHFATKNILFSKDGKSARVWWENNTQWCGEVQNQQKFRESNNDEGYNLFVNSNGEQTWMYKNEYISPAEFGEQYMIHDEDEEVIIEDGNDFLLDIDVSVIYNNLSKKLNINLFETSVKFGEIRLTDYGNEENLYYYHPGLGVYQKMRNLL